MATHDATLASAQLTLERRSGRKAAKITTPFADPSHELTTNHKIFKYGNTPGTNKLKLDLIQTFEHWRCARASPDIPQAWVQRVTSGGHLPPPGAEDYKNPARQRGNPVSTRCDVDSVSARPSPQWASFSLSLVRCIVSSQRIYGAQGTMSRELSTATTPTASCTTFGNPAPTFLVMPLQLL